MMARITGGPGMDLARELLGLNPNPSPLNASLVADALSGGIQPLLEGILSELSAEGTAAEMAGIVELEPPIPDPIPQTPEYYRPGDRYLLPSLRGPGRRGRLLHAHGHDGRQRRHGAGARGRHRQQHQRRHREHRPPAQPGARGEDAGCGECWRASASPWTHPAWDISMELTPAPCAGLRMRDKRL